MEIEKAKIVKRIIAIVLLSTLTVGALIILPRYDKGNTPTTPTVTKETTTAKQEKTTEKATDEEETAGTGGNGGGGGGATTGAAKQEEVTERKTSNVVYTGGALPYCDYVDNSYFNEAVFIGDSVSLKLRYYVSNGSLGNANMSFCVGNFGSTNALRGSVISNVWDQVAATGRKRVYIMLGMNDLNAVGVDGAVSNMRTLCYKIQSAFQARNGYNPLIYIQSMTPINAKKNGTNGKVLNNANIKIYNQKLSGMAAANGWYFVDVASVMYNDEGFLRDDFCGDPNAMGLHFSAAGCSQWVWYLHTHAYDPSWAVYPLTIRYHKDGVVFNTYSEKYKAGDTFNIASPTVSGYDVDKATISGTFAHAGQEFDVYYTAKPTEPPTEAPTTPPPTQPTEPSTEPSTEPTTEPTTAPTTTEPQGETT
ncbi:MAG: SGNH/GDSL hydrolase family protein [Clostridia bacterium]|nr:SGNH/GDSL hydrolase family protein [Clostridia bacterium]